MCLVLSYDVANVIHVTRLTAFDFDTFRHLRVTFNLWPNLILLAVHTFCICPIPGQDR